MKKNQKWKKYAGIFCAGVIAVASCVGLHYTVNAKAESENEYEVENEDVVRGATSCPGEIEVTIRLGFLNADGSYNQTYDTEKYPFDCTYGTSHTSGANHRNKLKEFHPDNLKKLGVELPDESQYEWKGFIKSDMAVVSKSEMQKCNPTFYTFTSEQITWSGLKNHYFYLIYEEVEPETTVPETTEPETTEPETTVPETTVEETTTEEETTVEETTTEAETTVEETTTEAETTVEETTTEAETTVEETTEEETTVEETTEVETTVEETTTEAETTVEETTEEETTVEETTQEETTASADNTSAKTADFSNLPLWISALTVSGGTIGMFGYRKNRKKDK